MLISLFNCCFCLFSKIYNRMNCFTVLDPASAFPDNDFGQWRIGVVLMTIKTFLKRENLRGKIPKQ